MGGHVFGSKKAYWELQLDIVKARLDRDIKDTLKISYDSLEEDEKQIFMDIACFFIGDEVSRAMSIWKASGWRAEFAFQTLKDRCLVQVETCFDVEPSFGLLCHYEPRFILRMHDHLRDLGREMADDEKSHRRRLWRPGDSIQLNEIKEFQNARTWSEGKSFRYYIGRDHFRRYPLDGTQTELWAECFLEISKTSTCAQYLDLYFSGSGTELIPEWVPLQNLHSLYLDSFRLARLLQRDGQVSLGLKELYCSFEDVHHVNSELVSSFGTFKHLESLHLYGCSELTIEWNWLLKSVRKLNNLQFFKLKGFVVEGEIAFDDWFCKKSLEAISLCCVRKTRSVSIHGQLFRTLKSLKLCCMTDLSEVNLTRVTTLESLELLTCRKLRKVLCNYMPKLEMFHIRYCSTIRKIPNFERASCLKRIYISRCGKLQDISAIERLKRLKRIWIAYCPELKSIKAIEQLEGLKRIWIQGCPELEGVICFKELKELKRIFIGQCDRLQIIQCIEYLTRLESIIITACPKVQNISGMEELKGLKEMIIAVGPIISWVKRLPRLPSERTILMGRWGDGDYTFDSLYKIGDVLSGGDILPVRMHGDEDEDEDEVKWTAVEKTEKKMIDLFHEKQRSLGTLIFCALLFANGDCGCGEYMECDLYPPIYNDICIGTRIKMEGSIALRTGSSDKFTLYTCVVNQGVPSKCQCWTSTPCGIHEAFFIGLEAGKERKALRILRSLIGLGCVDNSEGVELIKDDSEGVELMIVSDFEGDDLYSDFEGYDLSEGYDPEYDELAEYADDDEKYDGSDDGD